MDIYDGVEWDWDGLVFRLGPVFILSTIYLDCLSIARLSNIGFVRVMMSGIACLQTRFFP